MPLLPLVLDGSLRPGAVFDTELPLEQAMQKFEEGIRLTRGCQAALKDAEQRVQVLLRTSGGEDVLEDFLDTFQGCLLVVSHDKHTQQLINALEVPVLAPRVRELVE